MENHNKSEKKRFYATARRRKTPPPSRKEFSKTFTYKMDFSLKTRRNKLTRPQWKVLLKRFPPRGKRCNKPRVCGGRTAKSGKGQSAASRETETATRKAKQSLQNSSGIFTLPRKTTLSKLETLNSAIPWLQTYRLPGMSAAPRFGTNTINTLFGKPDFRRRRRFATSPNISIAHVKKNGRPPKKTPRFIRILTFF